MRSIELCQLPGCDVYHPRKSLALTSLKQRLRVWTAEAINHSFMLDGLAKQGKVVSSVADSYLDAVLRPQRHRRINFYRMIGNEFEPVSLSDRRQHQDHFHHRE